MAISPPALPPFSRFYWQLSLTFLGLLLLAGFAYVMLTTNAMGQYVQERQQRLNAHVAEHMLLEVQPFIDGKVNEAAVGQIMHSMMAVNPGIEVYLLDPSGQILSYVALHKKVILEEVRLSPITQFIEQEGNIFIKGDDPRNPGQEKIFTAAAVKEEGNLSGYVYIVLAGEEYQSATEALWGSHIIRLTGRTFLFTLFAAMLIALLAIWLITRNLREIIQIVLRFKNGDLEERIPERNRGELTQLAKAFNSMADTIVADMDKLRTIERLRRELIGNVSHDLRTPLSVIQGYIETLLIKAEDTLPDEQKRYLEISLSSIRKLEKLVNDLFEFSKLEATQLAPERSVFYLGELVPDMLPAYQILAQEKELDIQIDIPENLPPVFADVAMIERVLQNLLENAIKFTPPGGTIHLIGVPTQSSVEIKISDTGMGIAEDELPFIFDRYHRGQSPNGQRNGTGLGLAIVKKLLQLHQSTISVKSKLNQGTTFSFALAQYH